LNRYVAAAGLGSRRDVESLIRHGRVTIDGAVVTDLASRVFANQVVLVDAKQLGVPRSTGVLLFKPAGEPALVVHPGELHTIMPLKVAESGAEIMLADPELAQRVADPRHKKAEIREGRRRLSYCGLEVEGLAPGEWRPLSPKEIERLRRSVRLPPRG
jgi:16S rRNA U516 pseudouridylate synthase RsuA-like enzyme